MDKLQTAVLDPLKPYLQPFAAALPEPVHDAIISLIGSPCHSALLLDLDVTKEPACTSLAISKALGLGIVGASAVVKVPQILKLVHSRSSAGVSFVSYALETASLLITLSYNVRQQFPFSTFGETALIAVQDVVVGVLVLTFAGKSAAAASFVAVVAASIYALLFDPNLVDAHTLAYLQAGAGVLGVASKVPQIYAIWKEGGTGQLSAFAVCISSTLSFSLFLELIMLTCFSVLGIQLPLRLPLAHLHHPPRSRRQNHPLQLCRCLLSQCHSRTADALLLEQPGKDEAGREEEQEPGGKGPCCWCYGGKQWCLPETGGEDSYD
jgi:mannose-P-dolichol utilization defect protein 1